MDSCRRNHRDWARCSGLTGHDGLVRTDPVAALRSLVADGVAAVASVDIVWIQLPLRRPHVAAHGTETTREVVLVGAADSDGLCGWGECSALSLPTYTAEYTAGAFDVLAGSMVPALIAQQRWAQPDHPMASAAVEAAVIDLALRRSGRSLAAMLGATTTSVGRCVVITGADTVPEMLDVVARAVSGGADMVKLKVSAPWDPAVLDAVAASWPDLAVAVDANGSIANEPKLLSALDAHHVAYIEQPAPAGDDRGLAAIAAQLSVPIALDESVTTASALNDSLAGGAGTMVNIKPSRVGGLVSALECVDVARSHGAAVFVGGMLETGVGRAAAVALAAAVACDDSVTSLSTDLGPSDQYFDTDITDPVMVDNRGRLKVPDGVGIGLAPHRQRLEECGVRRVSLGGR